MGNQTKGDYHVGNHLRGRNFSLQAAIVTTSNSDLVLDYSSESNIFFVGAVEGQIVTLPEASDVDMHVGHEYRFYNDSSVVVTVRDFVLDVLHEIHPGCYHAFILQDRSTPKGVWYICHVRLSCVMVDTEHVSGVSGGNAQEFLFDYMAQVGIPIQNEAPVGETDCVNLSFTTAYEFVSGTLDVRIDGVSLLPDDFAVTLDHKGFSILLNPDDRNGMKSAPHRDEEIRVWYSRRVIF